MNKRWQSIAVAAAGTLLAGVAAFPCEALAERQKKMVRWSDIFNLVDQHPKIGESRALAAAAKGGVDAAGLVPNPTLDATVGREAPPETGTGGAVWGVSISIPLEWIARRGYQMDAAQADLESAAQEARAARLEVLLQLRTQFVHLSHAQAIVASLMETERQTAQLAGLLKRRVELGEARPVEATRAEIELEKTRIDLGAAQSREKTLNEQLRIWLNGVGDADVTVEADLASIPPPSDLDAAIAKVRSGHPALRAALARVAARTAEVNAEKRQRVPGVALKVFHDREPDRAAFGAGLAFELPLWNWNSGKIAQAEGVRLAEERSAGIAVAELLSSVVESHRSCSEGRDRAARFTGAIVPKAEQAAAAIERSFLAGETGLLDALDARRVLGEARRDRLGSLLRAQIDCSRVKTLIGEEDFQ